MDPDCGGSVNSRFYRPITGCLWLACALGLPLALLGAVDENFSTDPISQGRFTAESAGTESAFVYNAAAQNLAARLDVDRSSAFYLSSAFNPVTDFDTASFSVRFRIEELDNSVPPTAFFGLLTATHVENFGDGVTLNLATSAGQVVATASIDNSGYSKKGGSEIPLQLKTEYVAFGRYSGATRQFTIDIFTGANFTNHVGTSVADWPLDRHFSVDRLGLQNGGARQADSTSGSLTVVVDDLATPGRPPVSISIADISVKEGSGGSAEATFHVTLSLPSDVPVTVDYATVNGTALAGEDYLATSGTLTIPAGGTVASIVVPIVPDRLGERAETFELLLSRPLHAQLAASRARATITDDDTPSLTINSLAFVEGNAALPDLLLPVTLSNPSSESVSVRYATADGTAVAGLDYVSTNGILVFPPGSTSQRLAVRILPDTIAESNETFSVMLSAPVNAALGATQAEITLLDDDPAPVISVGPQTITEGDIGPRNAAFTLRLSRPSALSVTVAYATSNGSAIAGVDYLAKNGTVTFAPGEVEKTEPVTVLGDTVPEEDETFELVLSAPVNATLGDQVRAFCTIVDDDRTPAISLEDASVMEGGKGQFNLLRMNVRLSRPASSAVTVSYATSGGTATAGVDFISTNGVVQFAPGVTNHAIAVITVGDDANEPNEVFHVRLDNPLHATVAKADATGTIINDDGVSLAISDDVTVTEGDSADVQAVFTVVLAGTPTQPVVVSYTTRDRSATAPLDYNSVTGQLRFEVGQNIRTISVPVRADVLDEPDEFFELNLLPAQGATLARAQGVCRIIDNDPPSVSINSVQVVEGSSSPTTARLTVSLSSPTFEEVRVQYALVEGTATAGKDFLPGSGTLVFPIGVSSLPLEVVVLADTIDEPDEILFARLLDPVGATLGANAQGTCTIKDDDDPPRISIDDLEVVECTGGTANASFTVALSAPSERTVSVTFSTGDGSAVGGADFTPHTIVVTFPPGTTSQTVSVPLHCDLSDEPSEFFMGYLSNPVYGFIEDGSARAVIIDDDPPEILVSDILIAEGDSGTTSGVFRLTLSSVLANPIAVDFATADGTAMAGQDYAHVSGNVVFPAGATNITVTVPVLGDTLPEGAETFRLVLANPVGARLVRIEALATIQDDDLPSIEPGDATVVEGDPQRPMAIVPVRLSRRTPQTVTISYATQDGSARAGSDFVQSAGTLTFAPEETSKEIQIPILDDAIVEGNETFLLAFFNPINAVIADTQAQVTVVDNDGAPVIFVNDEETPEGNAGPHNIVFTFRLSAPSSSTVTTRYVTTNAAALSGSDYFAKSGTVSFPPGMTNQIVAVTVQGDTLYEPDEDFFLLLIDPVNARLARPQARAVIKNDDAPSLVAVDDITVAEGPAGQRTNAVFRVRLSPANALPVTVAFTTAARTARAPADFLPVQGTLTFAPGQTEQTVAVPVLGDNETELDETFALQLSSPVNAALGRGEALGIILNDDGLPLRVSDGSVVESNSGQVTMTFGVALGRAATEPVTVQYATADVTALAGSDYVAASGSLTFPPGFTNRTISIVILGDLKDEPDETFAVRLSAPENATLARAEGMGTIIDDDPPDVSIDDVTVIASAAESADALFTISLSSRSSDLVTVDYATANGTATAGTDYSEAAGTLTFAPGELQRTLKLMVKGNTLDETNEFFVVNLSNPKHARLVDAQGVCTILNEGSVRPPPQISISDLTVLEGSTGLTPAEFTVSLSAPSDREVTVAFATTDGSALAGSDYQAVNGTLHFTPAANSGASVTPTNAVPPKLMIARGSDGVILSWPSSYGAGTVQSAEDIATARWVSHSGSPSLVRDQLQLSIRPVNPRRFYRLASNVLFGPGETNKIITVWVAADAVYEPSETFFVNLSNPSNATLSRSRAVGTIKDDDAAPVLAINDVTVAEGNSGTSPATFTVSLTGATALPVTVSYATADGTGKAGVDYQAASGTLTFSPGESSKSVVVQVIGNTTLQPDRTFLVNLSTAVQATIGKGQGTGTIKDDDTAPVLAINDATVAEGNSGTTPATFTVSLTGATALPVTVSYATADGTGKAGVDYQAASGTLTFNPGEMSKSVVVQVIGNTTKQTDRTFVVNLSAAVQATIGKGQGTGTIKDDDAAPVLAINDVTVAEGQQRDEPCHVHREFDWSDGLASDRKLRDCRWHRQSRCGLPGGHRKPHIRAG
jgi:disulfide oxidoreductase YuzD